jgi:hypothetical protein
MKLKMVCSLLIILLVLLATSDFNVIASPTVSGIQWSKAYSITGETPLSVVKSSDDGFLLLLSNLLDSGVPYLLKVDSSGNEQWNRTYPGTISGYGHYITQTTDGGYAITTEYEKSILLLKVDKSGNQQWNQTYIGMDESTAACVIQTVDGGYALLGNLIGDGSILSVWLVKTDSNGNTQWNHTLGEGIASSLIQTSDGGFAVASDFRIIKLDSEGNQQWNETYAGGDKNTAYSVVQTSDNNFALGGWMWLRNDSGGDYITIVKTDLNGRLTWTKYFGSGTSRSMIRANDGNDLAIIGGTGFGNDKLTIVDMTGNVKDEKDLQVTAYSMVQTTTGNFIIAGESVVNSTVLPTLTMVGLSDNQYTPEPSAAPSFFSQNLPFIIIAMAIAVLSIILLTLIRHARHKVVPAAELFS